MPLSWQPGATRDLLIARARMLNGIRAFFASRGVLEVETPLLASSTSTDPWLASLSVPYDQRSWYLQTSPEFFMKRLLAAGSGPIYQVARAFRADEHGSRHNPEFSLLEWYRPGFSLADLVDETQALVMDVCRWFPGAGVPDVYRYSYRQLFVEFVGIDPMRATDAALEAAARERLPGLPGSWDRDGWLNVLMSEWIEPRLPAGLVFVSGFPPSQAALARLHQESDGVWVASRVELYAGGMELANGYHELSDADEQARRFRSDLEARSSLGLDGLPFPGLLVDALEAGLPDCAGIALGLDRLLMWLSGADSISDVLAFDITRC